MSDFHELQRLEQLKKRMGLVSGRMEDLSERAQMRLEIFMVLYRTKMNLSGQSWMNTDDVVDRAIRVADRLLHGEVVTRKARGNAPDLSKEHLDGSGRTIVYPASPCREHHGQPAEGMYSTVCLACGYVFSEEELEERTPGGED